MSKASLSDTTRAPESWAEVRAHDTVMRYLRTGAGRPVLVLRSPETPDPLGPALIETLRRSYRLIVPEPPAPDVDVSGWIAGFLEGLGTATVRILATDRFCIPALELALLESDQITRIVLISDGPATTDAGRGLLETAMGRSGVPLLVVRNAQPAHEAVALIADFLAEETAAAS